MSLKAIGHFCAVKPFYVIGFWILLMIVSGILSQTCLEDALKGGQGPTKDLEFALAAKLKDKKIALHDSKLDGSENRSEEKSDEGEGSESNESILVVTSDKYLFPSEQYINASNGFLVEIQTRIDGNQDLDFHQDFVWGYIGSGTSSYSSCFL